MGEATGFDYATTSEGRVVVTHHGRVATKLKGRAAAQFLVDVEREDPQLLMARVTGNYKHGNERMRKDRSATVSDRFPRTSSASTVRSGFEL